MREFKLRTSQRPRPLPTGRWAMSQRWNDLLFAHWPMPAAAIEALLPVMRELGLVTIFWDVNFGNVQKLFDEQGNLLDQSYVRRVDKFLNELIWMARVLRYGRENIPEVKAE